MKSTLPTCKGFLGFVFGHRFEPRYSKLQPTKETTSEEFVASKIAELVNNFKPGSNDSVDDKEFKLRAITTAIANLREMHKKVIPGTYCRDICIHCGFVVENFNVPSGGERRLDTEL
jgi:hypothetical protein